MNKISTDIAIVGAGPCGLFAVFEAGLLKMKCHLIDYLAVPGGQLAEIYPYKPIYDIPGYPEILAKDLVSNLMKQIEPFHPGFTLGERVEQITKSPDDRFILQTNRGTMIESSIVAIAGGLGCFEPRKPDLENLAFFEDKGIDYIIKDPSVFTGKRVVIAGGGDSALDWAIYLSNICKSLTLVHRRTEFRGAPQSVAELEKLESEGKINVLVNAEVRICRNQAK
jgi:thioredoxin reductase (NADPH)